MSYGGVTLKGTLKLKAELVWTSSFKAASFSEHLRKSLNVILDWREKEQTDLS